MPCDEPKTDAPASWVLKTGQDFMLWGSVGPQTPGLLLGKGKDSCFLRIHPSRPKSWFGVLVATCSVWAKGMWAACGGGKHFSESELVWFRSLVQMRSPEYPLQY